MPATVHLWSERQLELSELFPRQDEQVHSTVLDGESVLLNLSSGRYYTLNVVGSTIWNLCRGEQSLSENGATDKTRIRQAGARET